MLIDIGYLYLNHLNNLSAQIIDDKQKKTLVSASSIEKDLRKKNEKN